MPKKPIDYSKTHFYKIVCNDTNITSCYVGHTTDFKRRKYEHGSCCNNEHSKMYHYKLYQTVRNNGGWCNWSMILIDTLPCNSSLEAKKKEREFMEELNASLNKAYPVRSKQEYYQDNKEVLNVKNKNNYHKNKEAYRERRKQHEEENKEYLKEKAKENYLKNKEVRQQKSKIYRE